LIAYNDVPRRGGILEEINLSNLSYAKEYPSKILAHKPINKTVLGEKLQHRGDPYPYKLFEAGKSPRNQLHQDLENELISSHGHIMRRN
jgi:hypothetical protein